MADSSKPDTSSDPTSSVSAQDASTTQGAKAAGVNPPQGTPSSAGGAATAQQDASGQTVKVQIEQAPDAPDVHYDGTNLPQREHVRADYQPFDWNA